MTPRQKELARHALGLPNAAKRSYRNRFFTAPTIANPDFVDWSSMVAIGCAQGVRETETMARFWLTRKGADAALLRGESLDPEDFPKAVNA
jgi:hypothetical protein